MSETEPDWKPWQRTAVAVVRKALAGEALQFEPFNWGYDLGACVRLGEWCRAYSFDGALADVMLQKGIGDFEVGVIAGEYLAVKLKRALTRRRYSLEGEKHAEAVQA